MKSDRRRVRDLSALGDLKRDPDGTAAVLSDIAADMLAAAPFIRAQAMFVETVRVRPHLIAQLFDREAVRTAARQWFADFAKQNPAEAGGGGHAAPADKAALGEPSPETFSALGHTAIADSGHPSGAQHAEPHDTGGGHSSDAAKANFVVPPSGVSKSRTDGGHSFTAEEAISGLLPSVRPQSSRDIRAQAKAARHIVTTVFDSFKVRDGRAIGDVPFGQLERLRGANVIEASVLSQIQQHVQALPETLVRDALKTSDLERFIQRAAEAADVRPG